MITDIMGMSGRAMIEALIAGESDPTKLASLANYRLKASQQNLREALRGRVTTHHRFLLRLHLNQIDALNVAVAMIDRQVEAGIAPFRVAVEQVSTIPGIKDVGAQVIISEIGTDMSRFPSDGHLISWAGLCPRSDESAGKRRSNRLRKGTPCGRAQEGQVPARPILAAQGAAGSQEGNHGVAAAILGAIYHMLKNGTLYQDLGFNHFRTDQKVKKPCAWSNA